MPKPKIRWKKMLNQNFAGKKCWTLNQKFAIKKIRRGKNSGAENSQEKNLETNL